MKIKTKVWIEKDKQLIIGGGKALILDAIEETGSINKAARKLAMSYRHAWSYIREIEKRLERPLVVRDRGGRGGGGARLTAEAKKIVAKYKIIKKEVDSFADRKFKEVFG